MTYLYLDIETIPAQTPAEKARIAAGVKVPGNIKLPKSIAEWEQEKKPAAVEEAIAKSSLDGTYGHICCIGFAYGEKPAQSLMWGDPNMDDELSLLRVFTDHLQLGYASTIPTIVGHNVVGFDIRFIWQRAIVLGVRMPGWFPRDPKPWGNEAFDTMTAWAGSRNFIGMDNLSAALGLEGKGEIDGSMVGQIWADGKREEIAAYCRADVERTRAIHRKMMVAYGEAA